MHSVMSVLNTYMHSATFSRALGVTPAPARRRPRLRLPRLARNGSCNPMLRKNLNRTSRNLIGTTKNDRDVLVVGIRCLAMRNLLLWNINACVHTIMLNILIFI